MIRTLQPSIQVDSKEATENNTISLLIVYLFGNRTKTGFNLPLQHLFQIEKNQIFDVSVQLLQARNSFEKFEVKSNYNNDRTYPQHSVHSTNFNVST